MQEQDSTSENELKVTDRRLFTTSGERRPGVEANPFEEKFPPEPKTSAAPKAAAPVAAKPEPKKPGAAARAERLAAREITFSSLLQDLYATCAMQLGAGQTGQLDLEGARETIDLLGLLQEKTRGNLDPAEEQLMSNALFDLRRAYVEVQRAASSRVQPAAPRR